MIQHQPIAMKKGAELLLRIASKTANAMKKESAHHLEAV
jgi:hypothetical protein